MKYLKLLSVLLCFVLVASLLPMTAVTASAAGSSYAYAYDCQRSPAFPKKGESFTASSIKDPITTGSAATSGSAGNWVLTSKGYYTSDLGKTLGASSYFDAVIKNVAKTYGLEATQVEVHELTKDGVHVAYGTIFAKSNNTDAITTFLGDNWNSWGCTYLLSDTPITGRTTVIIDQDLTTNAPPAQPQHHVAVTQKDTGKANEAMAQVTCDVDGCTEHHYHVALKAPATMTLAELGGDVRSAAVIEIEYLVNAPKAGAATTLPGGITVSGEPGFKYSPTGRDYQPVNDYTPKAGYYQASILVSNGGADYNLFVTFSVTDPTVTAATGDERPVELMFAGMFLFAAMAAAALALDSKRRV